MSLPTVQQLKDYARIETDAENALLADVLARATGLVQGLVGRSLTSDSVVWYDDAGTLKLYGAPTRLCLQHRFVDPASVVLTDAQGVVVPATDYTVRVDLAMLVAAPDVSFGNGPYAIACTAGYATSEQYASVYSAQIAQIVLDTALFFYQQRTPGATREAATGTSVDYQCDPATGLPERIAADIRALRGVVLAR